MSPKKESEKGHPSGGVMIFAACSLFLMLLFIWIIPLLEGAGLEVGEESREACAELLQQELLPGQSVYCTAEEYQCSCAITECTSVRGTELCKHIQEITIRRRK